MKAVIIVLFSLLYYIHPLIAQNHTYSPDKIRPLKIGDKVPDVLLTNIHNYNTDKAHLYDFKKQLLIVDFWGVYCSACIGAMPEMEALQKEFKGKIQIILPTKNTEPQIKDLFKRSSVARNAKLPSIWGDTILSRLFLYQGMPTHVWIDKSGIVRAITNGYNTNAKSIQNFLSGENIHFTVKNPTIPLAELYTKPLWLADNGSLVKYLKYYSYIMRDISSYQGASNIIRDSVSGKIVGIEDIRLSLLSLYKQAYTEIQIKLNWVTVRYFLK